MTFVYRLDPEGPARLNVAESPGEPPQAPMLFNQLRGILRDTYQKLGGAEAFHRPEQESWGE